MKFSQKGRRILRAIYRSLGAIAISTSIACMYGMPPEESPVMYGMPPDVAEETEDTNEETE
jgi:hypothetical protein